MLTVVTSLLFFWMRRWEVWEPLCEAVFAPYIFKVRWSDLIIPHLISAVILSAWCWMALVSWQKMSAGFTETKSADQWSKNRKKAHTHKINTNETTFLQWVELLLNSAATATYRNIYSGGKTGQEGRQICGPMPRISSILLLSVPGLKQPSPSKLPL